MNDLNDLLGNDKIIVLYCVISIILYFIYVNINKITLKGSTNTYTA